MSGDESSPADPLPHLDGEALVLAGAKASVPPARLPELLIRVQETLASRLDDYRRRYESAVATVVSEAFFVPRGHWTELGAELGLDERESDAVRRTHEEQLRRLGAGRGRREEFETALEVREVVVVGLDSESEAGADAEPASGT